MRIWGVVRDELLVPNAIKSVNYMVMYKVEDGRSICFFKTLIRDWDRNMELG